MILYYKLRALLVPMLLRLLPRKAPIIFKGENSAVQLAEQAALLGHKNILIVTDSFLGSSGILEPVKQAFADHGVKTVVFDGVQPDPTYNQCLEGFEQLQQHQCDGVYAMGGGSVLDAAKLIAMLRTNPGELAKFDGVQKFKKPGIPLFAVPTTSGTGSEITIAAVISDTEKQRKVVLADTKLLPDFIALDANLTRGMPPSVTAATGMDALTHAIESYLSKGSIPSTETKALTAVRLIFQNLQRAFDNGDDMQARDSMAVASFYAGAAFTITSVGYVHAVAHQLGKFCHTPHGMANAMVLPEVLEKYGNCIDQRMAHIAAAAGVGDDSDSDAVRSRKLIDAIIELRANLQLPLQPKGLKASDVEELITEAIKEAGSLYPVPRYFSRQDIRDIVTPLIAENT